MSGVTRWEVEGEQATGLGARYRMLLRVGSAEVGGLIELVEFSPPATSPGRRSPAIDQRGRWRIRARGGALARVELRLQYGVAGSGHLGLDRRAARRAASSAATCAARCSSSSAQVEHEQLRVQAAARRSARAAS